VERDREEKKIFKYGRENSTDSKISCEITAKFSGIGEALPVSKSFRRKKQRKNTGVSSYGFDKGAMLFQKGSAHGMLQLGLLSLWSL
jgi:hypothetical protein